MAGQQTRTREQQVINFQADNLKASEKLSLQYQYREIALNLKFAADAGTNGDYDSASILGGDEWSVVESVEIAVNGGDVIQSFTGEELRMYNLFYNERPPRPTTFAGGGSMSCDSTLIIPFWDRRSFFPLDTLLDSARLSDLRVNVRWGNIDSIANFSGNADFTASPILKVNSRECFGLVAKNPKTGKLETPQFSLCRRVRNVNAAPIPAQDAFQYRLPTGNIYKALLINTKDALGNDLPNCIDHLRLSVGTTVLVDGDLKTLRDWQASNERRVTGIVDSTFAPIPMGVSAKTLEDAWTYLNFVDDGYVSEAYDTFTYGEFVLTLKVNQTIDKLIIIGDQVAPIRT